MAQVFFVLILSNYIVGNGLMMNYLDKGDWGTLQSLITKEIISIAILPYRNGEVIMASSKIIAFKVKALYIYPVVKSF